MTFTINEIATGIGGLFILAGTVSYGLKKNGWLTFGKPVERRNNHQAVCDEHCDLVEKIDVMDKKLDHVSEGVAEIRGYLKGRNGF